MRDGIEYMHKRVRIVKHKTLIGDWEYQVQLFGSIANDMGWQRGWVIVCARGGIREARIVGRALLTLT